MQVLLSTGEKKDIIHFYNDIFIKTMRDHIIKIKGQEPSKTPVVNKEMLTTPMGCKT